MFQTKQIDNWKLSIYIPDSPPPAAGFPVLYILDGDAFTTLFAECMQLQIRNSPKTLVEPLAIIGIGYPSGKRFDKDRRFYDYTPARKHAKESGKRADFPDGGGLANFTAFLRKLQPQLCKAFPFHLEEQYLFGHSLGGLCAAQLFLLEEHLFSKYVACSPSLWWDREESFRLERETTTPRRAELLILVGALEGDMVSLAERFTQQLRANPLVAHPPAFYIAPDENHMSVVPTIASRALRFLSKKDT